jgi:hypothetical protein
MDDVNSDNDCYDNDRDDVDGDDDADEVSITQVKREKSYIIPTTNPTLYTHLSPIPTP